MADLTAGREGFVAKTMDNHILVAFSADPQQTPQSLETLTRQPFGSFIVVPVNWPTFRLRFSIPDLAGDKIVARTVTSHFPFFDYFGDRVCVRAAREQYRFRKAEIYWPIESDRNWPRGICWKTLSSVQGHRGHG